jgi:hypothetical protein
VAHGVGKRLLKRTFESDLSTALDLESYNQSVTFATEDHRLSIEAFKYKTTFTFRGR